MQAVHASNIGALQAALRYGLARAPKLVEIIAAVPEEHKASLVPQCVWRCCSCGHCAQGQAACAY